MNYQEFYQKPLVQIGYKDAQALVNEEESHWLIAVEGTETETENKRYHWKLFVFTANKYGTFDYSSPYFSTPHISCIHDAFRMATEIECQCKSDNFSSYPLATQIG
ncbi:hypothetical protein IM538_06175 [Cytobacillus suaedae]|nr:hypothetical protein IM538_06175 [Cytobacillus suaedae]